MMYGSNPGIDAPVVWWKGLDGSKIAAIPTYRGQAVFANHEKTPLQEEDLKFQAVTLDNRILLDSPIRYPSSLEEFSQRFGGKIKPLVASRADDPRQPEESVQIHSDPEKYCWTVGKHIMQCLPAPEAELETRPTDFRFRMPWGFCGNWIFNLSREVESKLLATERLFALGSAAGLTYPEKELEACWKNLLTAQHHDIQIIGLEHEAHSYLDPANERLDALLRTGMQQLAGASSSDASQAYLVFNPLQWDRTDWIPLGSSGTAGDVKGLGFSVVSLPQAEASCPFQWDADRGALTTPFYQAVYSDQGGILSLKESADNREIFMPGRKSGILAGMIDHEECESQGTVSVALETDRAVITETGYVGSIPYEMEWIYYARIPRIDWRCSIQTNRQKIGLPSENRGDDISAFLHEKKLRLKFYPALEPDAAALRDLPFAFAKAEENNVDGNYWTALADSRRAFAVFNRGLMGSVHEDDGAFSVPIAFSMYYIWDGCMDGVKVSQNGVSSMTCGAAVDGPHFMQGVYQYELAIQPFANAADAFLIHQKALEYNFPCVAVPAAKDKITPGALPQWQIRANTSVLSALYQKQGSLYARFCNHSDTEDTVSILSSGQPLALEPCDMLEHVSGKPATELRMLPWKVETVKLLM